ncbi:MAG TPA: hypothetical protein VFE62_18935 [Gemmataceae bacterium]|nr:hypothetical protein [Gemmataceae bacterium]
MNRRIFLGLVAAFVILGGAATGHTQDGQAKGEVSVLFIGNSLTYYNDLPKMVAELAKADKQPPLHYERETPGGCTFEKHWKDGKALAKIKSRKWDFVVLQDNSQGPLKMRESMFEYGKKLDDEIKKQGAKTILYMTWALQNRPEDQAAISKAYLDLAAELKCLTAPVGNAWETALKADKPPILHTKDKKHPTATGTYLAACVIYATIYGRSPVGLPGSIGKLADEEARPLQTIAWKAARKE